ncbi:tyrosine-type recombinase/integrase (plasmid) [Chondrinema litorale]|nr:tyrosine-type recombinase/integrase [Chondrinema litorale]UZR99030.1 tyrosine-type recombinase/integrase [Chondrinema litorale]
MLTKISGFYNRSPELLTLEEIKHYLYHCKEKQDLSSSFINQTISALRILRRDVLGENWEDGLRLHRPRRARKLPVILSREEVKRLLSMISNPKHRALVAVLYSSGIRMSELLSLYPTDIDADRMVIRVRQGKGNKDRETILSKKTLELLREYYRHAYPKPTKYLFEGMGGPGLKYSASSVRKILKRAARRAGIEKEIGAHILRHTFATHMLEQGTNLKILQQLLGHKSLKTTMVYLHVTMTDSRVKSPFDEL